MPTEPERQPVKDETQTTKPEASKGEGELNEAQLAAISGGAVVTVPGNFPDKGTTGSTSG